MSGRTSSTSKRYAVKTSLSGMLTGDMIHRCETVRYAISNPFISSYTYYQNMVTKGVSFGVADGVGGWIDSGVDPSLFSQALMYHARRYAMTAWAGEPETDPTQDYEERERVDGWEITPAECLELAYGGVLRERTVLAGEPS